MKINNRNTKTYLQYIASLFIKNQASYHVSPIKFPLQQLTKK